MSQAAMVRWGVVALSAGLAATGLIPPAAAATATPARAVAKAPNLDWPQYEHGPQHSSVSNATAFTPSNAASAHQVWHWQPPVITGKPAPALDASPTVVAGVVSIGAQNGGFYALNESTGAVRWSRQLAILTRLPVGANKVFAQPVFAQGTLFVATESGGLYSLAP
jgi:outer membrane protein assembly factor BamB